MSNAGGGSPAGKPLEWDMLERDGILEIFCGADGKFPQVAALHMESGYLRLTCAKSCTWGTSVVVLPTYWERGAASPVQGAPVALRSAGEKDGRLFLSLSALVGRLMTEVRVCLAQPNDRATKAFVMVTVSGNAALETGRPWDMFKPVMLSSMRVDYRTWDAESAYAHDRKLGLPGEGWIAEPPVPCQKFGLYGGCSPWRVGRGTHPWVGVMLDRTLPVTGWVTAGCTEDDDNVALWCAAPRVLDTWRYRVTARNPLWGCSAKTPIYGY